VARIGRESDMQISDTPRAQASTMTQRTMLRPISPTPRPALPTKAPPPVFTAAFAPSYKSPLKRSATGELTAPSPAKRQAVGATSSEKHALPVPPGSIQPMLQRETPKKAPVRRKSSLARGGARSGFVPQRTQQESGSHVQAPEIAHDASHREHCARESYRQSMAVPSPTRGSPTPSPRAMSMASISSPHGPDAMEWRSGVQDSSLQEEVYCGLQFEARG
jgi:hypothetical protein